MGNEPSIRDVAAVAVGAGARPAPADDLPKSLVLGRGRSGVVYAARGADGAELACKVFGARGLTKLVQCVLLGAPNPYQWCEDAVRCAFLRRELLAGIVPHWFGDRLRVARPVHVRWSAAHAAWELGAERVRGRPPGLRHPLRSPEPDEAGELARELLPELQARLVESGFDGLVWQAGRGNPVALNNFLLEESDGRRTWVWIDLESGVPALFPLDPRALLGYYLPRSLRLGRALFDDVDVARLRRWLARADGGPAGAERARLERLAAELDERQRRWKARPRHVGAIEYRQARGELDEETARSYRGRPLRWNLREARRAAARAPGLAGRLARALGRQLRRLELPKLPRRVARFLVSQRKRAQLARRYVARRIERWRLRGQLAPADARALRRELSHGESSEYLTDFGVHLAIKPFVKAGEYWLAPALFALGALDAVTLAIVLVAGGSLARTLYTGGRAVQAALAGREKPWVALGVGVLPVVGNFAYPLQILVSSTAEQDVLARFILHDGGAQLGEKLPIWGGRDTWTEHVLNRLPDGLARLGPRRSTGRSTGRSR